MVPFGVFPFLVRDSNILPQKELLWSLRFKLNLSKRGDQGPGLKVYGMV